MKYFIINSYLLAFIIISLNTFIIINGKVLIDDNRAENNKDQYYLIYINNTYGEYKLSLDLKNQKREESQIFIDSLVNKINNLIIDNKDTYNNPEKLDEIEKLSQLNRKKRSLDKEEFNNDGEFDFVYPIASINDRVVLFAYLSKKLESQINTIDNSIINCEPDQAKFSNNEYFNRVDINNETGWKGFKVRKNAELHLSLISQGKYDNNLVNQYDNNYYYPKSGGKDIDIVIIDSNFNFDYSEFSNANNRTVKCVAYIKNGLVITNDNELKCGNSKCNSFECHGRWISDNAAGLRFGVANQANVYGIALHNKNNNYRDSEIIRGLQYVHDHMIRSHKTIINMSINGYHKKNEFYKTSKKIIDSIVEKGGIFVSSAGNDGRDLDVKDNSNKVYNIPCEFDNVICVGGIDNRKEIPKADVYKKAKESNFGSSVNIYAPFFTRAQIIENDKLVTKILSGTSSSSSIVSGMIATIMGENPQIKYTKKTIYDQLYKNGINEYLIINGKKCLLANNGKRIVYSPDNKYFGCGTYSGNNKCSENECCSKYGWCGTTSEYCGTGCQHEFGVCSLPSNIAPSVSSDPNRCGLSFGKCTKPDECCSQYGWCGKTSKHCGTGCQSEFGICN